MGTQYFLVRIYSEFERISEASTFVTWAVRWILEAVLVAENVGFRLVSKIANGLTLIPGRKDLSLEGELLGLVIFNCMSSAEIRRNACFRL